MTDAPTLSVTLTTGRTIDQGVGKELGKTSREYADSVATCFIDPTDMKKLGIKDKTNVLITTEKGSVILKGRKSLRGPHPGLIYIPYGPWANGVIGSETDGVGMPSSKGITARVESAGPRAVLSLTELLKKQFGKL